MTEKEIIVLPVTREIIEKTMLNTQKKYSNTYKTLMYNRTPVELLDNIYGRYSKKCSRFIFAFS